MRSVTTVQVVALFITDSWAEASRRYPRLFKDWTMEDYYEVRANLLCDLLQAAAGK